MKLFYSRYPNVLIIYIHVIHICVDFVILIAIYIEVKKRELFDHEKATANNCKTKRY